MSSPDPEEGSSLPESDIDASGLSRPEFDIDARGLSKSFASLKAVDGITLQVERGECYGVLGPNGAGKSTLIKAVLDLVPRASGRVMMYGKPYSEQRHLVAYVPQRESVDWDFPVSALDVVTMGLYGKLGWFRPVGQWRQSCRNRCRSRQ